VGKESLQIPFAMLEFLASRPDGRATVDEFIQELKALKSRQSSEQFSNLDSVDALQTGLVVQENDGLRITEAGRLVLRAVEDFGNSSPDAEGFERSQSLEVDAPSDAEMRQRIFDLELRATADSPARESLEDELEIDQTIQPDSALPFENRIEAEVAQTAGQPAGERRDTNSLTVLARAPSSFKQEPGKLERSASPPSRSSARSTTVASNLKRLGGILRGHIEQEAPNIRTGARGGGVGGLVLSVLALLVIIICAGTYIAVAQIKSLKSEISGLEKELAPLKRQVAISEQQEKVRKEQNIPPVIAPVDKRTSVAETRPTSTALVLSSDEVRLIREYIKPSPVAGAAAQPINVGDPVTTGTIPLPSPLTEKIPKLLGARFTIRNGAIVILKRESRHADAVLGPN